MTEENKFDELIQSRLSERDFPFDEMNWDEAEKQIIRHESRVRLARYGLIFAGGIIAGMALMSPFILTNHTITSVQTNIPQQPTLTYSTGKPALVSDGKIPVNSSPRSIASVQTRPDEQFGRAKGVSPVSFSSGSSHPLNHGVEQPAVNGTGFAITNDPVVSTPTQTASPVVADSVRSETSISNIKSASPTLMPWYDSTQPEMPMLRVSYGQTNRWGKFRNSVILDAGMNYSVGWNNNGIKEGSGFTPLLGVAFRHYFNGKIWASLGIQAQLLNGLNKAYASQLTQYDFGANQNITTLTPKTLYYLGLPLKAGYHLNDKNIVGGGLTLLYLLNASSTQTTYHQNYFGTSDYTSSTKWGYVDGFSSTDIQVSLSYTLMLTSKFGISAEYYYGLFNVENSSFFGISQFDRNSGARVELKYRILK